MRALWESYWRYSDSRQSHYYKFTFLTSSITIKTEECPSRSLNLDSAATWLASANLTWTTSWKVIYCFVKQTSTPTAEIFLFVKQEKITLFKHWWHVWEPSLKGRASRLHRWVKIDFPTISDSRVYLQTELYWDKIISHEPPPHEEEVKPYQFTVSCLQMKRYHATSWGK